MKRAANIRQNSDLRYVAFLRGINVGGHASIKMADLQAAFEKMGFREVRTVLASGNVNFKSERSDQKALAKKIESGLKKSFNKCINVMLRGLDDLEKLRSSEPFKGIKVTPSMRFYVTFFAEKTQPRTIAIPYSTPTGDFRILQATSGEIFSIVDLSMGKGTPEAMNIIEKEFGSNVTTRNWNTVLKVLL